MTFLHPLALIGLAAAAIPALLHLRQRRTPPLLDFPAVRYLAEAERRSARRLRLRHLLLLLLRTALIVALVLAAARPLVPGWGAGTGHAPTALAIVLDNSLSAGVVVDGRPVFEGLRGAARAVLAESGAGDRLWLLLADGLVRGGSKTELSAMIDASRPDARRLDLSDAVRRAEVLVAGVPLPAREVQVLSDDQRSALTGAPLTAPHGVRVVGLTPGGAVPNHGIGDARVIDGRVHITVGGTPGGAETPLTVSYRGRVVTRTLVTPGETLSVALPPAPPGWWTGEAVLEPDELRADDVHPFVARVAAPARVTAGGESGPFVGAALEVLRAAGRVAPGAEVTIGPDVGAARAIVTPPADPARLGVINRAIASHGGHWRFGAPGTPGPLVPRAEALRLVAGIGVVRRYRLDGGGVGADSGAVLATVNGEPWAVRDGGMVLIASLLDTAWTALPASPAFVPLVDALVNVVARGELPVGVAEGAPGVAFAVRGSDTTGVTVTGPDPRESDLTPASPALLRLALGAELYAAADLPREAFAGNRRADASGLLLLALLLAGAEWGVATLAD